MAIADRAESRLEDEVLAKQASAEAAAFAELYDRYLSVVYRYIRSQVPDHATAEDLTAQVFVKSFVASSTFRAEGSYRAWIFQIARNTVSSWRGTTGRQELLVERIPEDMTNKSPDVVGVDEEGRDVLKETMAHLPHAQREVLHLRYWKDLSIDEIATSTRRSSGAVRQLLHRARRRMRKTLSARGVGAIAGATGASALAYYSIKRHREHK